MSYQNMCSDIVSKHMCRDIYSPMNRIIHGSLEIRNLSSPVQSRYLTRLLRSLVIY